MAIKKFLTTTLAVGTLAGGVLAASVTPANAGVWSNCTDSYACFWNYDNWTGGKWQFAGWNSNWADYGVSNMDNSMVNDGNTSAVDLYSGTSYTGNWLCVAKGYGLTSYPSYYGANQTSSNGWYSGNGGYC